MHKIDFLFANKNLGDKQGEVSAKLCEFLEGKKDFSVEFKYDKTPKQHRGYWRLCSLLAPHLQDKYGEVFDKDLVSELVKKSCGYIITVQKRELTKSLKNANRDQLGIFIEKLYQICEFFGLKDYELMPEELRDMNNYFNNNPN
jgi:hypothetical protein